MDRVLVTCPPMLGMLDEFTAFAESREVQLVPAETTQVLSTGELCSLLPDYDGWIIGDDPATSEVLAAGREGRLRAAVKWGIGIDNVDFAACADLGIPITNTPNMFGGEVADVAIGYLVGLARETFMIDREIRAGAWPKPPGISISGKRVGLVGFGDIGKQTARRLYGFEVQVTVYDPAMIGDTGFDFARFATFPEFLGEQDFLIFTCSLNEHNFHMLNADTIARMKPGARVINIARGPLIDETALANALASGHISSAALDVFEVEPLPPNSPLRQLPRCIFGSHNSSNTREGVRRASFEAIDRLAEFLHG